MKKIAVGMINFYQMFLSFDTGMLRVLAPGGACRHSVTCSEYTKQAIIGNGVLKGSLLGVKRILSCNPFFTK